MYHSHEDLNWSKKANQLKIPPRTETVLRKNLIYLNELWSSTFYMKPVKENQTFQTREVNSLPAVRWKRHVQTLLTFEVENRLFLYPLPWNVQFCLVKTVFKTTDLQTSLTDMGWFYFTLLAEVAMTTVTTITFR